jgi:hypothetical protein
MCRVTTPLETLASGSFMACNYRGVGVSPCRSSRILSNK